MPGAECFYPAAGRAIDVSRYRAPTSLFYFVAGGGAAGETLRGRYPRPQSCFDVLHAADCAGGGRRRRRYSNRAGSGSQGLAEIILVAIEPREYPRRHSLDLVPM